MPAHCPLCYAGHRVDMVAEGIQDIAPRPYKLAPASPYPPKCVGAQMPQDLICALALMGAVPRYAVLNAADVRCFAPRCNYCCCAQAGPTRPLGHRADAPSQACRGETWGPNAAPLTPGTEPAARRCCNVANT